MISPLHGEEYLHDNYYDEVEGLSVDEKVLKIKSWLLQCVTDNWQNSISRDNNTLHTDPRAARFFCLQDFRRGPVNVAVIRIQCS